MTILCETPAHLVEFEDGLFTVARRSDGHCLSSTRRGWSSDFRNMLKRDGKDGAISRAMRVLQAEGSTWQPLYKPHRIAYA